MNSKEGGGGGGKKRKSTSMIGDAMASGAQKRARSQMIGKNSIRKEKNANKEEEEGEPSSKAIDDPTIGKNELKELLKSQGALKKGVTLEEASQFMMEGTRTRRTAAKQMYKQGGRTLRLFAKGTGPALTANVAEEVKKIQEEVRDTGLSQADKDFVKQRDEVSPPPVFKQPTIKTKGKPIVIERIEQPVQQVVAPVLNQPIIKTKGKPIVLQRIEPNAAVTVPADASIAQQMQAFQESQKKEDEREALQRQEDQRQRQIQKAAEGGLLVIQSAKDLSINEKALERTWAQEEAAAQEHADKVRNQKSSAGLEDVVRKDVAAIARGTLRQAKAIKDFSLSEQQLKRQQDFINGISQQAYEVKKDVVKDYLGGKYALQYADIKQKNDLYAAHDEAKQLLFERKLKILTGDEPEDRYTNLLANYKQQVLNDMIARAAPKKKKAKQQAALADDQILQAPIEEEEVKEQQKPQDIYMDQPQRAYELLYRPKFFKASNNEDQLKYFKSQADIHRILPKESGVALQKKFPAIVPQFSLLAENDDEYMEELKKRIHDDVEDQRYSSRITTRDFQRRFAQPLSQLIQRMGYNLALFGDESEGTGVPYKFARPIKDQTLNDFDALNTYIGERFFAGNDPLTTMIPDEQIQQFTQNVQELSQEFKEDKIKLRDMDIQAGLIAQVGQQFHKVVYGNPLQKYFLQTTLEAEKYDLDWSKKDFGKNNLLLTDAGKQLFEEMMNTLINNLATTVGFYDVDTYSRNIKGWHVPALGAQREGYNMRIDSAFGISNTLEKLLQLRYDYGILLGDQDALKRIVRPLPGIKANDKYDDFVVFNPQKGGINKGYYSFEHPKLNEKKDEQHQIADYLTKFVFPEDILLSYYSTADELRKQAADKLLLKDVLDDDQLMPEAQREDVKQLLQKIGEEGGGDELMKELIGDDNLNILQRLDADIQDVTQEEAEQEEQMRQQNTPSFPTEQQQSAFKSRRRLLNPTQFSLDDDQMSLLPSQIIEDSPGTIATRKKISVPRSKPIMEEQLEDLDLYWDDLISAQESGVTAVLDSRMQRSNALLDAFEISKSLQLVDPREELKLDDDGIVNIPQDDAVLQMLVDTQDVQGMLQEQAVLEEQLAQKMSAIIPERVDPSQLISMIDQQTIQNEEIFDNVQNEEWELALDATRHNGREPYLLARHLQQDQDFESKLDDLMLVSDDQILQQPPVLDDAFAHQLLQTQELSSSLKEATEKYQYVLAQGKDVLTQTDQIFMSQGFIAPPSQPSIETMSIENIFMPRIRHANPVNLLQQQMPDQINIQNNLITDRLRDYDQFIANQQQDSKGTIAATDELRQAQNNLEHFKQLHENSMTRVVNMAKQYNKMLMQQFPGDNRDIRIPTKPHVIVQLAPNGSYLQLIDQALNRATERGRFLNDLYVNADKRVSDAKQILDGYNKYKGQVNDTVSQLNQIMLRYPNFDGQQIDSVLNEMEIRDEDFKDNVLQQVQNIGKFLDSDRTRLNKLEKEYQDALANINKHTQTHAEHQQKLQQLQNSVSQSPLNKYFGGVLSITDDEKAADYKLRVQHYLDQAKTQAEEAKNQAEVLEALYKNSKQLMAQIDNPVKKAQGAYLNTLNNVGNIVSTLRSLPDVLNKKEGRTLNRQLAVLGQSTNAQRLEQFMQQDVIPLTDKLLKIAPTYQSRYNDVQREIDRIKEDSKSAEKEYEEYKKLLARQQLQYNDLIAKKGEIESQKQLYRRMDDVKQAIISEDYDRVDQIMNLPKDSSLLKVKQAKYLEELVQEHKDDYDEQDYATLQRYLDDDEEQSQTIEKYGRALTIGDVFEQQNYKFTPVAKNIQENARQTFEKQRQLLSQVAHRPAVRKSIASELKFDQMQDFIRHEKDETKKDLAMIALLTNNMQQYQQYADNMIKVQRELSYFNTLYGKGPLSGDKAEIAKVIEQNHMVQVGDRFDDILRIQQEVANNMAAGNFNTLKDQQRAILAGFQDIISNLQKIEGEDTKRTALGHMRLLSKEFTNTFMNELYNKPEMINYLQRAPGKEAMNNIVNGTGLSDIGGIMGQVVAAASYNIRQHLNPNRDLLDGEVKQIGTITEQLADIIQKNGLIEVIRPQELQSQLTRYYKDMMTSGRSEILSKMAEMGMQQDLQSILENVDDERFSQLLSNQMRPFDIKEAFRQVRQRTGIAREEDSDYDDDDVVIDQDNDYHFGMNIANRSERRKQLQLEEEKNAEAMQNDSEQINTYSNKGRQNQLPLFYEWDMQQRPESVRQTAFRELANDKKEAYIADVTERMMGRLKSKFSNAGNEIPYIGSKDILNKNNYGESLYSTPHLQQMKVPLNNRLLEMGNEMQQEALKDLQRKKVELEKEHAQTQQKGAEQLDLESAHQSLMPSDIHAMQAHLRQHVIPRIAKANNRKISQASQLRLHDEGKLRDMKDHYVQYQLDLLDNMPHILDEYAADIEADIYSAKPVSSTKLKNLTLIENAIMNAYVNVKTALDDSRMRNQISPQAEKIWNKAANSKEFKSLQDTMNELKQEALGHNNAIYVNNQQFIDSAINQLENMQQQQKITQEVNMSAQKFQQAFQEQAMNRLKQAGLQQFMQEQQLAQARQQLQNAGIMPRVGGGAPGMSAPRPMGVRQAEAMQREEAQQVQQQKTVEGKLVGISDKASQQIQQLQAINEDDLRFLRNVVYDKQLKRLRYRDPQRPGQMRDLTPEEEKRVANILIIIMLALYSAHVKKLTAKEKDEAAARLREKINEGGDRQTNTAKLLAAVNKMVQSIKGEGQAPNENAEEGDIGGTAAV